MVEFRVDEDVVVERLLGRGRADDNEDVIRHRQEVYRSETAPLLDYYRDILVTHRRGRRDGGDHRSGAGRAARPDVTRGGVLTGLRWDVCRRRMIEIKSTDELQAMRAAGLVVARTLRARRRGCQGLA